MLWVKIYTAITIYFLRNYFYFKIKNIFLEFMYYNYVVHSIHLLYIIIVDKNAPINYLIKVKLYIAVIIFFFNVNNENDLFSLIIIYNYVISYNSL